MAQWPVQRMNISYEIKAALKRAKQHADCGKNARRPSVIFRSERRRALERRAVSGASMLAQGRPVVAGRVAIKLQCEHKERQRLFSGALAQGRRRHLNGRNLAAANGAVARHFLRRGIACLLVCRRHRSRALQNDIISAARLGTFPATEQAHQTDDPRHAANGQMGRHDWETKKHKRILRFQPIYDLRLESVRRLPFRTRVILRGGATSGQGKREDCRTFNYQSLPSHDELLQSFFGFLFIRRPCQLLMRARRTQFGPIIQATPADRAKVVDFPFHRFHRRITFRTFGFLLWIYAHFAFPCKLRTHLPYY